MADFFKSPTTDIDNALNILNPGSQSCGGKDY